MHGDFIGYGIVFYTHHIDTATYSLCDNEGITTTKTLLFYAKNKINRLELIKNFTCSDLFN